MFIWTCVLFQTVSEIELFECTTAKLLIRKICVRTVCNIGIHCSSNRVGTVYNKCSKNPPSTSMHFATRVKTWRVVLLSASWRSFMQVITSRMLTSSSSRVSTFFLYTSLFLSMCGTVWSMTCWLVPLFQTIVWQDKITRLSAKWITKTTRGCSFGCTDCYVLSAWRSPFSLYPTCDATSQWHFP